MVTGTTPDAVSPPSTLRVTMRGPASTTRRATADSVALARITAPPAAPCSDSDDDDPCPVCYKPFAPTCGECPVPAAAEATAAETAAAEAAAAAAAPVVCKTCKHAVCAECDKMLTKAGHDRCPNARTRTLALILTLAQHHP